MEKIHLFRIVDFHIPDLLTHVEQLGYHTFFFFVFYQRNQTWFV